MHEAETKDCYSDLLMTKRHIIEYKQCSMQYKSQLARLPNAKINKKELINSISSIYKLYIT